MHGSLERWAGKKSFSILTSFTNICFWYLDYFNPEFKKSHDSSLSNFISRVFPLLAQSKFQEFEH
jgi:hypothetical protein